jgi:hypothetical protein
MSRDRLTTAAAAYLVLALLVAACSKSPSPSPAASTQVAASSVPSPSADASPTPTPTPPSYDPASILLQFDATPDAVVDPFGDTRLDRIGGNLWYVPGPDFTLYGDGTVIFRDDEAARANPQLDGRNFIAPPLSIGHLSAGQVEEVLNHAWHAGGLADAKRLYETGAQDLYISATFTMSAGQREKHVELRGLFLDPSSRDADERKRLVGLADYLRHLDESIGIDVQPWNPDRYWGGLQVVDTSFTGDPRNEWPWDDIGLEGWLGGRRSLLPSHVEALGIGAVPGGYCCHLMSGPGGDDPPYTGYGLSIAPAFPEPIETDAVAEVVTIDLVVRTAPGTDDATSTILKPTLDSPRLLYVVDGPVAADGYDWYLVQAFAEDFLPHGPMPGGWLAAGGQDGEPWIAPWSIYCPPAELGEVSRLSEVARLACYGGQTLTLEGTFGGCFVSDPAVISPEWLAHTGCNLLPDGYRADVIPGTGSLVLRLHGVQINAASGARIRVRGHFDDPAAQTCTSQSTADPAPIPELVVLGCRTQFVVTAVIVV